MTTVPRWPDIYDALLNLVSTLPALSGVEVFDGQPISNDTPLDYIVVGFVADDTSGSYRQTREASGVATMETGEIRCHFVSQAGDSDPTLTRARAFQMVSYVQAALESDVTLSGLLEPTTVFDLNVDVMAVQSSAGSAQSLLVTIAYVTTTYF